jgi:hypothetical protein
MRLDFACCDQILGPTVFNVTNCFFCIGASDCVGSPAAEAPPARVVQGML